MRPSVWRATLPIVLLVGLAYWLITRQQEGFQVTPTNASLADVRGLVAAIQTLIATLQAAPTPDQTAITSATQELATYQAVVSAGADPTTLPYSDIQSTLATVQQTTQLALAANAANSPATTAQIQQLKTLSQQYLTLLQASATPNTTTIQGVQSQLTAFDTMLTSGPITITTSDADKEITSVQSLIQGMSTTGSTTGASTTANQYVGIKVNSSLTALYTAIMSISTSAVGDKIYDTTNPTTPVWQAGDTAPTSTAITNYAFVGTPLAVDPAQSAAWKDFVSKEYATYGISIIDLVFVDPTGALVDSTGAALFTPSSASASAASAAAAAITEPPATQPAAASTNNTLLYVGIGVGVVVVVGGIAYAVLSKKS
jgi:hypothetical protein